jgi:crossover junction endodeoxyribonuclease RusA
VTTHLTLPWPPSLNRIYRAVPRGKKASIVLSEAARSYKRAAAAALPVGRVPPPLSGRLLVWMTLHPPLKLAGARWDIANREKLMIDTLTEQRVWLDDSQIDAMVILRGEPSGAGRVELTIHTLEPGVPPL